MAISLARIRFICSAGIGTMSRPCHRICPGDTPGRHRDQLEDRQRGDGLAAAGFADHADRLAAFDGQIDAIHRVHDAIVGGKMGLEPPDIEQRGFAGGLLFVVHHNRSARHLHDLPGSSASRNPSPMKLMVSTVRKIAAPANSAQCGAMSR